MSSSKDNIYWLSFIKAIAMLGVVGIHVAGYSGEADNARNTLVGITSIIIATIGLCSVPLFVMVSGALLLNPDSFDGTYEFVKHRVLRILIPLFFWNFFYFLFLRVYLKIDLTAAQGLVYSLHGNLYSGLYYFWVILGLSILAPIIIPFIKERSNEVIFYGLISCVIPVFSTAFAYLRPGEPVIIHTPWTWFMPYIGYFLLGWGLRNFVLTKSQFAIALIFVTFLLIALYSTWGVKNANKIESGLYPASYYSFGVHLYTICVYMIIRSSAAYLNKWKINPKFKIMLCDGFQLFGGATLGVFGLHLAILSILLHQEWFGLDPSSNSFSVLIFRILTIYFLTYGIVISVRKIQYMRRFF